MSKKYDSNEMIAALDAFAADEEVDGENASRLYDIVEGFRALADSARVIPAMFSVMERFPNAYLGTPGPLVHAIESLGADNYEPQLIESIRRQPAELNVWMLNRILNTPLSIERRHVLLDLMRATLDHPKATERVVELARDFLEHQTGQQGTP